MSFDTAMARLASLNSLIAGPTAPATTAPATTTPTATPSTDDFAQMLRTASVTGAPAPGATTATGTAAAGAVAPAAAPSGNSPAARLVAMAQAEVGQAEQPPGSNDSPRIAQYRSAVAGAPGPGPWCAYFASWAARQAGTPLGEYGQGFARVDDVWAWGVRSGRTTQTPQPGDLVVWDEHIGIVESVKPDGSITTVEGNSSDAVSHRTYGPDHGGAVGFVRIG